MKIRIGMYVGVALVFGLAACGDHNSSTDGTVSAPTPTPSASASPVQTVDQKIAALEADGSLPRLDRSDSLLGPDANSDGVRDDIEAYLKSRNFTALQLSAAMQMARALQATLTVPLNNRTAALAAMKASDRAIDCLYLRFPIGSSVEPITVGGILESITTNTKARLRAYLAYNSALDGSVSSVSKENTCAD